MAGDWIKMREDLHEDPAVLQMAQELDVRPETIVGFCHRFWGLVSRQTCDGKVTGVALLSLGNIIGLPGFPEMLLKVGWLEYDDSGGEPVVTIPKFDRHLSEGAKTRALKSERKRQERARIVADVSQEDCDPVATRERVRVRVKKNPPNPPAAAVGLSLDDSTESLEPDVANVVAYWIERVPAARPGDKERARICEALTAGYHEQQLCLALTGYLQSKPEKPTLRAALRDPGQISGWITAALERDRNPDKLTTPDVATELERGKWRRAAEKAGRPQEWIDEQCKAKFGE